jgi:hypothetical protein
MHFLCIIISHLHLHGGQCAKKNVLGSMNLLTCKLVLQEMVVYGKSHMFKDNACSFQQKLLSPLEFHLF